ncbi:MAG TPA: SMR family transporter [Coleofasciculaceae cyanobacterium]
MTSYPLLIPLLLISAFLNTLGQSLLKLGAGQNPMNAYLLGGLTAYALSTVFYIIILGKLNLSLTYPLVIGLTIAATTFSGAFFLKESVAPVQWVGIGLMLAGMSAIAFGKIS